MQSQRNEESFNVFYERVLQDSTNLTSEPTLPRQRRPPRRRDGASTHIFEDVKAYFRQLYYQALDVASEELKRRFDQNRGMHIAASVEKTLLDGCNHCQSDTTIPEDLGIYANELDLQRLQIQLQMLPDLVRAYNEQTKNTTKKVTNLRTLCDVMTAVSSSRTLLSEVSKLLHIAFTIPVTSATAEWTFSALRHLKTFLRSAMTQTRLNHIMILHIHKDKTNQINLDDVEREFISANDRRKRYF